MERARLELQAILWQKQFSRSIRSHEAARFLPLEILFARAEDGSKVLCVRAIVGAGMAAGPVWGAILACQQVAMGFSVSWPHR